MIIRTMVLGIAMLAISGCNQNVDQPHDAAPAHESHAAMSAHSEATAEQVAYICPMHADVVSATPDECSKCGMKLVANQEMSADKAGTASKPMEHMHN